MLDIAALRDDTPALSEAIGNPPIHFNNCGSSLPPAPVLAATIDYLQYEARFGGYEAAADRIHDLDAVYRAGSEMLGCGAEELAFTTSAGVSWWRAFEAVGLRPGDRVLISTTEYQANAFAFLQAQRAGVIVDTVPATDSGEIDLDALRSLLDERVRLVSLTHISMTNGMVQPAAEVGAIVAETDALYLLDSCQAAGQMPLDVDHLQCDFLAFTGRKFLRGPRGTGLLYVRSGIMDRLADSSYIDGRSATWTTLDRYDLHPTAQRFEMGEYTYGAKVGFGVAIDYALRIGLDAIADRVTDLSADLRTALGELDGVQVLDQGSIQSGIVTFTIEGVDAADAVDRLRGDGINTSPLDASLAQLDLGQRGIPSVVRAGVHYFNTDEEIARLVAGVSDCLTGRS